ncbi:MAG: hypothetical protein AAFY50_25705, partial [Cyanobacteria bacterium J06648_1]
RFRNARLLSKITDIANFHLSLNCSNYQTFPGSFDHFGGDAVKFVDFNYALNLAKQAIYKSEITISNPSDRSAARTRRSSSDD